MPCEQVMYQHWSRMLIICSSTTPWYKGPDVKFWAAARSPKELEVVAIRHAHKITGLSRDTKIRVKFNDVPRSALIAGADPKWHSLDEATINELGIPGGSKKDPGTYIKVIRADDEVQAKEKGQKLWSTMAKSVKDHKMTKRGHDLTGLTAATNWSMIKTHRTGGNNWIDGVQSRAKMKAAITKIGQGIKAKAVASRGSDVRLHVCCCSVCMHMCLCVNKCTC